MESLNPGSHGNVMVDGRGKGPITDANGPEGTGFPKFAVLTNRGQTADFGFFGQPKKPLTRAYGLVSVVSEGT